MFAESYCTCGRGGCFECEAQRQQKNWRDQPREWESADLFQFADGSVRLAWVKWRKENVYAERRCVGVREIGR